jgi:hypothetical protein
LVQWLLSDKKKITEKKGSQMQITGDEGRGMTSGD